MYRFKNLEDSYKIYVRHSLPDDTYNSYSAKIDLTAHKTEKGDYLFTLLNRHDVLVDDERPEQASDVVLTEIGDSFYPIILSVSQERKIISVENFDEIKERWEKKREELLKKYPTFELEQHFKASGKNMNDKDSFYKVLQRDAFIQFYFLPVENDVMTFDLHNFPKHGYKMMYYGIKNKKESTPETENYLVSPAFGNSEIKHTDGTLSCHQSKEGDYESMELMVNLLMDEYTYYRRKVTLSRDENFKRSVNLWLY